MVICTFQSQYQKLIIWSMVAIARVGQAIAGTQKYSVAVVKDSDSRLKKEVTFFFFKGKKEVTYNPNYLLFYLFI